MSPVDLTISNHLIPYPQALEAMKARVSGILEDSAPESAWFLEHPALYTAGTSAKEGDFLGSHPLPVFESGRGGQYTYHGPGQRVAYLMLDLRTRDRDVRAFVSAVERWISLSLGEFSLTSRTYSDRVGIWVDTPKGEAKIAAIGLRITKWVSYHGVAINVCPNLDHFKGIVPCGISDLGITSLEDLGLPITMTDLDVALIKHFETTFDAPLTQANKPII